MARALVVAMVCGVLGSIGCGGGSSTPSLVGSWIIENDTTGKAIGADISADGTYVALILAITNTSPPTANAQVEKGNWSSTPTMVTFTPTEWSCTGPDPVSTASYSFNGPNLVISGPSGATSFMPNNVPAASSFQVTYGCFDANGNFAAQPLGPTT